MNNSSSSTSSNNPPQLPPLNRDREDIPFRPIVFTAEIGTIQPVPVLWDIAIDECGTCRSLTGRTTRKGDCQSECLSFFNIITPEVAIAFSNSLSTDPHSWAGKLPSNKLLAEYISQSNAAATNQTLIRYDFNCIHLNKDNLYDWLDEKLRGDDNTPHSTFMTVQWEVTDPNQRGALDGDGKRYASHVFTIGMTRNMEVSIYDTQIAETTSGGVYVGRAGLSQYFNHHYPYNLMFCILCRVPSGGGKKHTRKYKRSNRPKRSVKRNNSHKRSINRSNRPKRSVKRNNRHKKNYKRMTRGGRKCRR